MKDFIVLFLLSLLITSLGAGNIYASRHGGYNGLNGLRSEAYVTWTGGPDLAIIYFIPPVVVNHDRKIITIQDFTANLGTTSAGESVTRYYLSETEPPFDFSVARFIGERIVSSIKPDGENHGAEIVVPFPDDLESEIYYLAACADANSTVTELDEFNNCSYSHLNSPKQYTVVPAIYSANSPPDCTSASTDIDKLWPPNHKMVSVNINGITDPEDYPVSITITSIHQDEPVNGLGDGDTSPDGKGVGTATAELRAERSGTGNGRIYIIGFTATDDKEASCSGTVMVGVPHDKGGKTTPIDSGKRYDSTLP
jgi:hypothetical protein